MLSRFTMNCFQTRALFATGTNMVDVFHYALPIITLHAAKPLRLGPIPTLARPDKVLVRMSPDAPHVAESVNRSEKEYMSWTASGHPDDSSTAGFGSDTRLARCFDTGNRSDVHFRLATFQKQNGFPGEVAFSCRRFSSTNPSRNWISSLQTNT